MGVECNRSFLKYDWEEKNTHYEWVQMANERLFLNAANNFKPKVAENNWKRGKEKKKKRGYQSKMVIHSHTGNFVIDSHILSRWEHYPGLLISKGVYFCITLIVTLKCKRLNLIQWRLTIEIAPHVCHRRTHWVRIQGNYLPVRMRLLGERDDWLISCELCTQTRQKVLYCNLRN